MSQGMVDVVFADVAQPDQARIVALNAHNFLMNQGHFVISIKVQVLMSINFTCSHGFADHLFAHLYRQTVLIALQNLPRSLLVR